MVLVRNTELISHHQPEEFRKGQKETPHVQPLPGILLSGIHVGWIRRVPPGRTLSQKKKKWSHSVVSESLRLPWTVACQAPPSLGFSRQEYWSGLPFPSPEDLLDPGIELGSPALQADPLKSEPPGMSHRGIRCSSYALQPSESEWLAKDHPETNLITIKLQATWQSCSPGFPYRMAFHPGALFQ